MKGENHYFNVINFVHLRWKDMILWRPVMVRKWKITYGAEMKFLEKNSAVHEWKRTWISGGSCCYSIKFEEWCQKTGNREHDLHSAHRRAFMAKDSKHKTALWSVKLTFLLDRVVKTTVTRYGFSDGTEELELV